MFSNWSLYTANEYKIGEEVFIVKRTYQPSKLRRARKHDSVTGRQLKTVAAYWQLVVVNEAAHENEPRLMPSVVTVGIDNR